VSESNIFLSFWRKIFSLLEKKISPSIYFFEVRKKEEGLSNFLFNKPSRIFFSVLETGTGITYADPEP